MTLENLLRIGKLKAHAADEAEIARVLASAERALKDAAHAALSADSRLELAYRAIMPHLRSNPAAEGRADPRCVEALGPEPHPSSAAGRRQAGS